MATFPPTVPQKWANQITVEVVDENTVRLKTKSGTVLKTMTKAEYESTFAPKEQAHTG